eukprot:55566-Prymnesium_polylepis.1
MPPEARSKERRAGRRQAETASHAAPQLFLPVAAARFGAERGGVRSRGDGSNRGHGSGIPGQLCCWRQASSGSVRRVQ